MYLDVNVVSLPLQGDVQSDNIYVMNLKLLQWLLLSCIFVNPARH